MTNDDFPSGPRAAAWAALTVLVVTGAGCIGGHFETKTPASALDAPTRAVVDSINATRSARGLPPGTWVDELRPPAMRAALGVARGDLSLTSAAQAAAQGGVAELGRHIWSFATTCTDVRRFQPPPMVVAHPQLLFAVAIAASGGGSGLPNSTVMLLIAEPGISSIRAEQMGGGRGGTNPSFGVYVHPAVASGPCGESWPVASRTPM